MRSRKVLRVEVVEADSDTPLLSRRREITITGRRNCETLRRLVEVERRGLSSLDVPGQRLSHYVMQLRRAGLEIETVNENAGDGVWYGRYVLRSTVVIPDADREAA